MNQNHNNLDQPIGFPMSTWKPCALPPRESMQGRYCRLEPLDPARHADDLFQANSLDSENRNWTYLPVGPFEQSADYRAWLEQVHTQDDPLFHAIIDGKSNKAVGVASFLRIDPSNGVIEVGHINYSPLLQKTAAATEAMFLMMQRVFDALGYRRYEWKCDALNAGSRAAAERLGFQFEGIFRQAIIYKGRNRDTAWYSIIDSEWPALKSAFETWLAPENFTVDGQQRQRLTSLTLPPNIS